MIYDKLTKSNGLLGASSLRSRLSLGSSALFGPRRLMRFAIPTIITTVQKNLQHESVMDSLADKTDFRWLTYWLEHIADLE